MRGLDNPATDPPLTLRVHPNDDPNDPNARRVIKRDDGWWMPVTRCDELRNWDSGFGIAAWPRTPMTVAVAAFATP